MDFDYRLPDSDAPEILIRRTAIGGIRVILDGERVPGRRGVYEVPGADGQAHLLRVTGAWTGLRAIADGWDVPLEAPVPLWSRALIVLPLALVIGGLVGVALGAVATALNAIVGRTPLRAPARALVMVAVLVAAGGAWATVGSALTTMGSASVSYTVGTCLSGLTPGTDLVTRAPTPVACDAPHDAEVVGTYAAADAAAYPGETALAGEAGQRCPPLFKDYVGVAFASSRLDILPVIPTQVAWDAGSRDVACAAVTMDGSKLTSSVRGSRR